LSLDEGAAGSHRRCADYSPNNRGIAMAGQRISLNVRVTGGH
jgi:hypothetical protein